MPSRHKFRRFGFRACLVTNGFVLDETIARKSQGPCCQQGGTDRSEQGHAVKVLHVTVIGRWLAIKEAVLSVESYSQSLGPPPAQPFATVEIENSSLFRVVRDVFSDIPHFGRLINFCSTHNGAATTEDAAGSLHSSLLPPGCTATRYCCGPL